MATLAAGMIIVLSTKRKGAKETLDIQVDGALALLAGLGLVGRFDPLRGGLQQKPHQGGRRLENRRPDQAFQLLDGFAGGVGHRKTLDQGLDFFALRKAEGLGEVFCFAPSSRSRRV
jgi:hypothetical protein